MPEPLGIKKAMDAVVSATFNRYSFETMNLLRARVKRWEREVRSTRCKIGGRDSRTATSSTSTWWNCLSNA